MLDIIRWAVAVLFGLFGVLVIVMNYAMIVDWLIHKRHHALSPLVGGICVSIGLLVCPVAHCRHWAWVPLVFDPGCAYSLLALIYILIVRRPFARVSMTEHKHPSRGEVEDVLAQIANLDKEAMPEELKLWVASEMTLNGTSVRHDVAMAVVVDNLLGLGYCPDGFMEAEGGRWYKYQLRL